MLLILDSHCATASQRLNVPAQKSTIHEWHLHQPSQSVRTHTFAFILSAQDSTFFLPLGTYGEKTETQPTKTEFSLVLNCEPNSESSCLFLHSKIPQVYSM